MSYEVKHEEKWFWVSNMKISKTAQKLHFRVTKKDTCFPFHFHVLNLFKSWSNLGFDKHGLDIFKPDKSCIYPLSTLNFVLIMKSSMKRSGFGFQITWKFQKPPKIKASF